MIAPFFRHCLLGKFNENFENFRRFVGSRVIWISHTFIVIGELLVRDGKQLGRWPKRNQSSTIKASLGPKRPTRVVSRGDSTEIILETRIRNRKVLLLLDKFRFNEL